MQEQWMHIHKFPCIYYVNRTDLIQRKSTMYKTLILIYFVIKTSKWATQGISQMCENMQRICLDLSTVCVDFKAVRKQQRCSLKNKN